MLGLNLDHMLKKARPSPCYGGENASGYMPATGLAAQGALAGEMNVAVDALRHGESSLDGTDTGRAIAVRDEQEAVRRSVTNKLS